MTRDQRLVVAGTVAAILFTTIAAWLLQQLLPVPDAPTTADRLAYALKWQALAAVPLLVMIATVGNSRFASEAIDPTLGRESRRLVVDARSVDNTTQQFLLFLGGSLALAANLTAERLPIVGAAAIVFVVARFAFWIGYRIKPAYRAFGFASTAYLNLALIAASLWLSLA